MSKNLIERNLTAPAEPLKRRGLLLGAGMAGAAALVVKALPSSIPVAAPVLAVEAAVDTTAGYQVTPHVLRYYETTRS